MVGESNSIPCFAQKAIRKQSRLNKRAKLDRILSDGAALALHGKTFDWYRKIRHLCPKQPNRRIQLFDDHGMPLTPTQEILAIKKYYIDLFADPGTSCLSFTFP